MEAERTAIIDTLSQPKMKDFLFHLQNLSVNINYQIKSVEESIRARKEGNAIYIKKKHTTEDHLIITHFYNKSIAYAPSESEVLMYAYSNKAFFLMHLNKYNEAIGSINRALHLTNSDKMKLKLYCQKVKCLAALGSSTKDDVLEQIDQIFRKSKLSIEDTTLTSIIIGKTKSVVASMKRYEPTNHKLLHEKEEFNKIVTEKEKVDTFDFVEIKSTKNMGRGLFAKTDFKTGDLVLVEQPCLIGPHFYNYVFCSHCLKVAWIGIPCEKCHDYIFCSAKCKNAAWKEYHHIECSITPYLIMCDPEIPKHVHMSLKIIITLLKDYETIDKLKSKFKISKNNQVGLVNDEAKPKITLFNKLMNLSHVLPKHIKDILTMYTFETLIVLMKSTLFFSVKLNVMQHNDFSKNEDFVFIGSLLLRLVKICAVNCHTLINLPSVSNWSQPHGSLIANDIKSKGSSMGLISSMINHSCAPNIRRFITDDMKYVYYALEPIASGTQLSDSYSTWFYNSPQTVRRKCNEMFVCKCIACEEDWPSLTYPGVDQEFMFHKMQFEQLTYLTEIGFICKIEPLMDRITPGRYRIDKDLLKTVVDMMDKVAEVLPQPSLARYVLCEALAGRENSERRIHWAFA
uniref:MYND-type domain-containing protein n=1 Tax=Trichogramma kaykai TaxID=54128 RepID=A0ABD2XGX6_9HYME